MHRVFLFVIVIFFCSLAPPAQDDEPKPELSKDRLSEEQIAIYRAVLDRYAGDQSGTMLLGNRTYPVDLSDEDREEAKHDPCFKSLQLEATAKPRPVVHMLDPAVALNGTIVLVDPDEQVKIIKANDRRDLASRQPQSSKQATDERPDTETSLASPAGLFELSEIIFDRRHRHAVVIFSFFCGRLCGAVEVLLLKRSGGKWKVSKSCGGGVS